MSEYNPSENYYILSIDIGVKNLGLALLSTSLDYKTKQVIYIEHVDITSFLHLSPKDEQKCHLHHTKTYTDYLEHLFYINFELFKLANWILIERQPPQGYVVVEQLIFSKYRDKSVLISPNSMHKWMGWKDIGYEQRKQQSVKFAYSLLKRKDLKTYFTNLDRNHDIADAICLGMYWISLQKQQYLLKQQNEKYRKQYKPVFQKLDQFKFKWIK